MAEASGKTSSRKFVTDVELKALRPGQTATDSLPGRGSGSILFECRTSGAVEAYYRRRGEGGLRIPRHPATQSTLIWPGIPRPSGHLFHGHPAGQSERSDAGVALLV